MKWILLLCIVMFLIACSSNPHKAEKIDTRVEYSQVVTGEQVVGVKNGNMVVQRKVLMSEELRKLQNETYEIEAKVYGGPRYYDNYGLYGVLKNCLIQDRTPMPEKRDYVVPDVEFTHIGIDEQKRLVGLSEEFLKDRLERFMTYRKILRDRADEYETKIELCEMNHKVASH